MHTNEKVIEALYSSFQKLNAEGMIRCYHPEVKFSDPVFPDLRGNEVTAMWKMLCSQAKNFELTYGEIEAYDHFGKAHWQASYDFSGSGRRVRNTINSRFVFRDSLIIQQYDDFNFWKWSSMALGPAGLILGWTPILRNKVRQQAATRLHKFMQKTNG